MMIWLNPSFTFHNVSIKTRRGHLRTDALSVPLHSTMFLLKHESFALKFVNRLSFTFHNVSIKTRTLKILCLRWCCFTFHNVSIKTYTYCRKNGIKYSFTFHNVSIKTRSVATSSWRNWPLHSTMFLLKLQLENRGRWCPHFTFHNVSIKTGCDVDWCCCVVFLYIPQCFY